MLTEISLLLLMFFQSGAGDFVNKEIFLGMTVEELREIKKFEIPYPLPAEWQWNSNEEIYGLKGSAAYTFKEGKLDWRQWNSYNDSLNEFYFNQSLSAAKLIIEDLKTKYGNPAQETLGDTNFVDPYDKWHWGYKVVEANWNIDHTEIEAGFNFFGGKGEFHFIVYIWHNRQEK